MSQLVIAKRYAKALFNLSYAEKNLDAVQSDLNELSHAFKASDSLQRTLEDPKVAKDVRQSILQALLNTAGAQELSKTFVFFLLSKQRVTLLPEIALLFGDLVRKQSQVLDVQVTVSQQVPENVQDQIRNKLATASGKSVQLHVNEDASILGGMITRVGSVVIDGSVRNQLKRVHQSIVRS